MGRRTYKNPPIEEALCEIRFSGCEWDIVTSPAALFEGLRLDYPGKPQSLVTTNVLTGPQLPTTVSVLPAGPRIRLTSLDEKRMVVVAPDLLSVHVLRPYPGWDEDFRARIDRALATYRRVAQPKAVVRIGVRFINRVVLSREAQPIDLDDYFNGVPASIDGLPDRISAFVHRVERAYDDTIKLVHTFASLETTGDSMVFLLDLDVIWEREKPEQIQDVMAVVEELRARQRTAFEATITDKLREVFDA